MSHLFNSELEEHAYDFGYDRGYSDCKSELSMKIKAILRTYLYSAKFMSPIELAKQIGDVLDSK